MNDTRSTEQDLDAEQVLISAGWSVLIRTRDGKVVQTIACHRATGKIIQTTMDNRMNEHWMYQTYRNLMEARP